MGIKRDERSWEEIEAAAEEAKKAEALKVAVEAIVDDEDPCAGCKDKDCCKKAE